MSPSLYLGKTKSVSLQLKIAPLCGWGGALERESPLTELKGRLLSAVGAGQMRRSMADTSGGVELTDENTVSNNPVKRQYKALCSSVLHCLRSGIAQERGSMTPKVASRPHPDHDASHLVKET